MQTEPFKVGEIRGSCTNPSYPILILGVREKGAYGGSTYKGAVLRTGPKFKMHGKSREIGVAEWQYGQALFKWDGELTDEESALAAKLLLTEAE